MMELQEDQQARDSQTFRKHKLKTLVGLLSVLQTQRAFFAGS